MKTTLALAALFTLVLGGGYLWKGSGSEQTQNTYDTEVVASSTTTTISSTTTQSSTKNSGTVAVPVTVPSGRYTQAQVATHNSSSSCWTIISGAVYDVTAWIAQHPGGKSAILGLCGKDGTSTFENQHGNDGRANSALASFKIGALAP